MTKTNLLSKSKYALCTLLIGLLILTTWQQQVKAATYYNSKIEGTSSNSNYKARTKVGSYYLWQKWVGSDGAALYYATSQKGKAIKIASGSYGISDTVTVVGSKIHYATKGEDSCIIYSYDTKTKKSTKIVKKNGSYNYQGLYGSKYYMSDRNRAVYSYTPSTKKTTKLISAPKNSNSYREILLYQNNLVVGSGKEYVEPLYVLNMTTGKAKTLTNYCYGGEDTAGFNIVNGRIVFKHFAKAVKSKKTSDFLISEYTFKDKKTTALLEVSGDILIDNIVFTKNTIYLHSNDPECLTYFSCDYNWENIKEISKKTFNKVAGF